MVDLITISDQHKDIIMKLTILKYVMLPGLGLALIVPSFAFAFGGGWPGTADPAVVAEHFTNMFQSQASILGISESELKDAWASGKSIEDIMTEKGITKEDVAARAKDARIKQLKTELQTLVDQGVITQAQADTRLSTVQNRMNDNSAGFSRGFGLLGGSGHRHMR